MVEVVLGGFDPILERGLIEILGEDRTFEVLSTGLSPTELKRTVMLCASEVMIIDEVAAREVLPCLSSCKASPGAVVLAGDPSVVYRRLANACGALCLPSSASSAELLAAVSLASSKRDTFKGPEGQFAGIESQELVKLTPREIDVLAQLSRDRSYAEIAFALKIGIETVRSHASSIRLKLNVRTRRELVGMPVPRLTGSEQSNQRIRELS